MIPVLNPPSFVLYGTKTSKVDNNKVKDIKIRELSNYHVLLENSQPPRGSFFIQPATVSSWLAVWKPQVQSAILSSEPAVSDLLTYCLLAILSHH
jgi:hypothetical protein